MKPSIILASVCAAMFAPGPCVNVALAGGMSVPVSAFLCDTSTHAVQFADAKAQGDEDEIAKDRVGRMAKAEVCGRYSGLATIESESITLKGGLAYKLTAFRFSKDQRVAWMAETSFAPARAELDL